MSRLVTLVGTITVIALLLASSLFVSVKAATSASEASTNTNTQGVKKQCLEALRINNEFCSILPSIELNICDF
jgi:YbbR domain-containing protein